MMKSILSAVMLALTVAVPLQAQTVTTTNGGDSFTAGTTVQRSYDTSGDVFAAGEVVKAGGVVRGDLHAAGMDVDIATNTGADLYAMGAVVTISAAVGEDVSAMGYSVRLAGDAAIGGNARFLGRTVIIDGPIEGALTLAAAEVTLNGAIAGDVSIAADQIAFGPEAVILGQLTYASDRELNIPERVIPADRVRFEAIDGNPVWNEIRDNWDDYELPVMPSFVSIFAAFLVTLAFFMVIGGIFLTFTPKPVASMRREIADRPGQIFLLGILGLSMLFGLVPITALTIVGLPFVPFAMLLILVAWTLGYILAAYAIAVRLLIGLGGPEKPSLLVRLLVLAFAVCLVTLLNFIPFVGWVVNYTLVLLGIGAMTSALFNWLIGNPGYAYDVDMKPIET